MRPGADELARRARAGMTPSRSLRQVVAERPWRLRGTRGAARSRRRSVLRCISTRMHRGVEPAMDSSRAQISGTSPRPMLRAAVAGKTLVRSSVAVNRIEMMSSWSTPLRSSISLHRAPPRVRRRARCRRRRRWWRPRRARTAAGMAAEPTGTPSRARRACRGGPRRRSWRTSA